MAVCVTACFEKCQFHDRLISGSIAASSEETTMLGRLVAASIRFRKGMLGLLGVLLALGVWAARTLPVDALPDVSTIQVAVLTQAAGLSAAEVERTVTMPV